MAFLTENGKFPGQTADPAAGYGRRNAVQLDDLAGEAT